MSKENKLLRELIKEFEENPELKEQKNSNETTYITMKNA